MAIIVTMYRETFKRYQVCEEDEYLFDIYPPEQNYQFFFGAQAIRRGGIVDEAYRSLCSSNVTKVTRK